MNNITCILTEGIQPTANWTILSRGFGVSWAIRIHEHASMFSVEFMNEMDDEMVCKAWDGKERSEDGWRCEYWWMPVFGIGM